MERVEVEAAVHWPAVDASTSRARELGMKVAIVGAVL